jgi:hypothetical protein
MHELNHEVPMLWSQILSSTWRKIGNFWNESKARLQFLFLKLPPYTRVARWFILRPKFPIWVYFGGPWKGKCWYILRPFGIIYDHLVKYMAVRYRLWSFGTFFPFWYVWNKKNLATLPYTQAGFDHATLKLQSPRCQTILLCRPRSHAYGFNV